MGQSCSGQRPNKAAAHRHPSKAKAKAKAGGHHHRHHHRAHPSASSRHAHPLAPAHPAYGVVDISEPFGLPHQPAQYQPAQHHHHHRPLPPPPHHHTSSRRHRSGSLRQAPLPSAQSASPPPPPVPPKRTHTRSSRHHRPVASTPYSHTAYQQAPRIKETVLHYHGHNYNFHDGEVSPLSPGDDVGPYSNRPVSPLTPPQTSHGSSATAGYPSYPGSEPYARASKTWRSY